MALARRRRETPGGLIWGLPPGPAGQETSLWVVRHPAQERPMAPTVWAGPVGSLQSPWEKPVEWGVSPRVRGKPLVDDTSVKGLG